MWYKIIIFCFPGRIGRITRNTTDMKVQSTWHPTAIMWWCTAVWSAVWSYWLWHAPGRTPTSVCAHRGLYTKLCSTQSWRQQRASSTQIHPAGYSTDSRKTSASLMKCCRWPLSALVRYFKSVLRLYTIIPMFHAVIGRNHIK